MDCAGIGLLIRRLRVEKGMTQRELAEIVGISDRAVSKWERGLGCPDISLLTDLAAVLSVGIEVLLNGELSQNRNDGGNMKRAKYYVCPMCGNLLLSTGAASVLCCGRPLEAETPIKADDDEKLRVEQVEDERFITTEHPMTKEHHIAFLAYATGDSVQLIRRYPEWDLQVRLPGRGHGTLFWYCTKHGLFYQYL